jgi:hypothetical protein
MPAEPESDEAGEQAPRVADGVRDLTDAWQVGLDAAQAMAQRVLDLYRDLPASTATGARGSLDGELRRLRVDLERAVDLSMDVFDRVLAIVGRLDPPTAADADDAGARDDLVELDAVAGARASAPLWLHNVSSASRPAPPLRCSALTNARGRVIAQKHARVEGSTHPVDAQNSRPLTLVVDVPAGTAAGVYHGLLLSGDDGDSVLRVQVRVTR